MLKRSSQDGSLAAGAEADAECGGVAMNCVTLPAVAASAAPVWQFGRGDVLSRIGLSVDWNDEESGKQTYGKSNCGQMPPECYKVIPRETEQGRISVAETG